MSRRMPESRARQRIDAAHGGAVLFLHVCTWVALAVVIGPPVLRLFSGGNGWGAFALAAFGLFIAGAFAPLTPPDD